MLHHFLSSSNRLPRHLAFGLAITLILISCAQASTPTLAPVTTPAPTLVQPTAVPPTDTQAPMIAPTETEAQAAAFASCSSVSQISLVQTPIPPVPTPTGVAPTPSASPTPRPPTPTPRPAPREDRIGFPEGYQDNFKLMYFYDRVDNRQVRVVCGNEAAASVKPGEPFPEGSILVMETWRAKVDADGNLVMDDKGHFIRATLAGIFVMRKEPGFGVDYQGLRTGEWEYVAYRPDESYLTPPEQTANCAACHLGATQDKDWVFRANELVFVLGQYAAAPAPGENEIAMNSMSFFPRTLSVKAGTTLMWINNDVIAHTMTANDGAVDSGLLNPGGQFSFTFNTEGTFAYHCSLHPEQMRASIEVTK